MTKKPKRGNIFESILSSKPKRNPFNLSYDNKLSCNMGELIPFFVQDVLPNDTFKVGNEYLMRAQPLLAPIMHNVDIYQHYFFVPTRLIWDEFNTFITGGEDGKQTAEMPYIKSNSIHNLNAKQKKLLDLLGYPNNSSSDGDNFIKLSSLRIRAYDLIYNEFYRDQNLQDPIIINKDSGLDSVSTLSMSIQNRPWRKDYFTSALPFAQRGDTVNIPYSGGTVALDLSSGNAQQVVNSNGGQAGALAAAGSAATSGTLYRSGTYQSSPSTPAYIDPNGTYKVNDFGIAVNDFRRANALQRWLERNARGGSRYVEIILNHFGIHPSDYRLQRPLYLGGGKQPFSIAEVVQTSSTEDGSTPQGNLSGKGIGTNSQFVFNETFEEHGFIIGILSVLPKASYYQGCSRHLTKFDKYDYAWPEFGNLGEQEILNKEIYCLTSGPGVDMQQNEEIFGYTSRYAEYKYNFDEIHGDFKNSLDFWHLGRKFLNRPLLNESFIVSDPSKRIFAIEDENEDSLLFDVYNNVTAIRCLPTYGTPSL